MTNQRPPFLQLTNHKASNKKRSESVTKRVTEDGWEEEVYEEYEEEEVRVKSTTLVTAADTEERERVAGGVTSKQTVESVTSDQSSRYTYTEYFCGVMLPILLSGSRMGRSWRLRTAQTGRCRTKRSLFPSRSVFVTRGNVNDPHLIIIRSIGRNCFRNSHNFSAAF